MKIILALSSIIVCSTFSADSLNVRLLGRFTATSPMEMVVSAGTGYVANSSGGLQILNVSNPSSIRELGYLFLPGSATGISLSRGYAVVSCTDSSLRILDPANPLSISLVGTFRGSSEIYRCFAIGDTVYTNGGKFSVISLDSPSSPMEIGSFGSVFASAGMFVFPPYAYLCEKNYGLSVVKYSNPSAPIGVGRYLALTNYVRCAFRDNRDLVYVGTNTGLYLYAQSGDSLVQRGFWASPAFVHDVVVRGCHAFLACGSAGLRILDVLDPGSPIEVGYYVLGSELTNVFLDYPIAWLSGQWARINAFDVTPFYEINETTLPEKKGLTIYPNPFNSSVNFKVFHSANKLDIYDIFGNLIESIELKKIDNFWVGSWTPSSETHSGLYFVKLDKSKKPSKVVFLK